MVPPGNYEQNHAEHPYEMTMEKFLLGLERIRQALWLDRGFFLTAENFIREIKENDVQNLFRFLSLTEVADVWGEGQPDELEKTVYEKLNAFLNRRVSVSNDDLKELWKKTSRTNRGIPGYPNDPVSKCIQAVEEYIDREELKRHYGVEDFPDSDKGRASDKSIVSILGLVLFWLAAVPCAEEARAEQIIYRKRLDLKLGLILAPESIAEFCSMAQKVYGDSVINDLTRTHSPEPFRADEERDHTQINENVIDKENVKNK